MTRMQGVGVVLCVGVAACSVLGPEEHEWAVVIGNVESGGDPESSPVFTVSRDGGTADVVFWTFGLSCMKPHRTDVVFVADTVFITPYDVEPRGMVCADAQVRLAHAARFEMETRTQVRVVIQGRGDMPGSLVRIEGVVQRAP